MHRAVSLTDLQGHPGEGPAKPAAGVNLDAVAAAVGRKLLAGWQALRSDEMWDTLWEATLELYHGTEDEYWELDTERAWEAAWVATATMYQGDAAADGEDESEE